MTELCDKCGAAMVKQFGTFGIQFKGNGFYKTDNAK
jgi:predicted nucleic acid-binding Zn ribbon protein